MKVVETVVVCWVERNPIEGTQSEVFESTSNQDFELST